MLAGGGRLVAVAAALHRRRCIGGAGRAGVGGVEAPLLHTVACSAAHMDVAAASDCPAALYTSAR